MVEPSSDSDRTGAGPTRPWASAMLGAFNTMTGAPDALVMSTDPTAVMCAERPPLRLSDQTYVSVPEFEPRDSISSIPALPNA